MIRQLLNSKLIKSIGVYTVSNIINAAIPFLLLPILTRYLTPGEFGLTATYTALVGFFAPLTGLFTQSALTRRFYDADKVDFNKYVTSCLFILLVSVLIISAILIPLGPYVAGLTEFPHSWLWAVIVTASCQYLVAVILGFWQAERKVYQYAAFQNTQALLNLLTSLLLVIALQMAWRGRILAHTLSIALFALLALYYLKKKGLLGKTVDKKYLADALKFSLPLIPYGFTGWVIMTMDRIFINNMVGIDQTGLYASAAQICMVIMLLQQSFNTGWVPWFYEKIKNNDALLNLKIVKFSYTFIAGNFLLAFLLGFAGPLFLQFFLGKTYAGASDFLLWLALGQAANAIHLIAVSFLNFHYKTIYLTYAALITTLIHIPLTYFLIKANGAVGAAQSFFFSNTLTSLFTFFLATRFHKMPWLLRGQKIAENS